MKKAVVVGVVLFLVANAAHAQFVERKALTVEAASHMTAACAAYAAKHDWHLAIWVLDESAIPLAFERMDGAGAMAVTTSQEKAKTALRLGHPSGDLSQGLAQGHLDILGLGLFPMQGGLPILADGHVVGAIGAGGAQSKEDEECAQAGLDAVLGHKK